MKLSPQQKLIVDYLSDGQWKCMATNDLFLKDDRKRISELNELGYDIIGMKCDKSCGIKHNSRIYMRKMRGVPERVKRQVVTQLPNGHVTISYL